MNNIEHAILDVEDIINYFSAKHYDDDWHKSEKNSSLGKLALELDNTIKSLNEDNIRKYKVLLSKIAESNRLIGKS
ncbi:hypothetical protein ABVB43_01490 [Staphylococcus cohnii]|uniref:hypothetical protein n=1 Tax=Staphylococcus cohnii TaxID=29382 RepID=UPI00374EC0F4